jgi:hypothetical protein
VNRRTSHSRIGESRENACLFPPTHVLPFHRGSQPPPNDKRKLRKELYRLNWALHCLHGVRSKLVLLLDRKDAQLIALRRERDAYANALQDLDPEAYEAAEQDRRDMDNPRRAIEWELRGSFDGGEES